VSTLPQRFFFFWLTNDFRSGRSSIHSRFGWSRSFRLNVEFSLTTFAGHSMELDSKAHALYIFGGQSDDRYLSDMHVYDLNTNTATEIFSNFTASGGPLPCFTQRSAIDPIAKEIYV
jgi:hypothetical protein